MQRGWNPELLNKSPKQASHGQGPGDSQTQVSNFFNLELNEQEQQTLDDFKKWNLYKKVGNNNIRFYEIDIKKAFQ